MEIENPTVKTAETILLTSCQLAENLLLGKNISSLFDNCWNISGGKNDASRKNGLFRKPNIDDNYLSKHSLK